MTQIPDPSPDSLARTAVEILFTKLDRIEDRQIEHGEMLREHGEMLRKHGVALGDHGELLHEIVGLLREPPREGP